MFSVSHDSSTSYSKSIVKLSGGMTVQAGWASPGDESIPKDEKMTSLFQWVPLPSIHTPRRRFIFYCPACPRRTSPARHEQAELKSSSSLLLTPWPVVFLGDDVYCVASWWLSSRHKWCKLARLYLPCSPLRDGYPLARMDGWHQHFCFLQISPESNQAWEREFLRSGFAVRVSNKAVHPLAGHKNISCEGYLVSLILLQRFPRWIGEKCVALFPYTCVRVFPLNLERK